MRYTKVKGILSPHNGMNIYRGCTHGCIYCDSRSLCYQIEPPFENVWVKENALELLDQTLKKKKKRIVVSTGSMTDPYNSTDDIVHFTRKSLEIIEQNHCGVAIITKSNKILNDLDILERINKESKVFVQMTLTTFDERLCKIIEPNVSSTKERVEALKILHEKGIETIVWLSPILPFINDTLANLKGILRYCIEAKVSSIICFGFGLTLREGNREYFYKKLDEHFPGLKDKYIKIYSNSYELNSPNNNMLYKYFLGACNRYNIETNIDKIFSRIGNYELKDKESFKQLSIFEVNDPPE